MTIHMYQCTMAACGAQITLDDELNQQDVVYPKGRGPGNPNYRPHNCATRGFMFPVADTIDKHPLVKKVTQWA